MRCLSHDDQWHRSIVESWRNEKAADHYNSLKRVSSLFLSVVVGYRFSSVFLKRKKKSVFLFLIYLSNFSIIMHLKMILL